GGDRALTFTPDSSMHPFAFGVTVRAQRDGAVATISGSTLTATMDMKREERGGGRGSLEFEATTLASATAFTSTIGAQGGVWTYKAANGTPVSSGVKADAQPHHLVLSHYTARGETLFFVDGHLAGKTSERLEPTSFALGIGANTAIFSVVNTVLQFLKTAGVDQIVRAGVERVRAVPGVDAAATSCCLPLEGGFGLGFITSAGRSRVPRMAVAAG